MTFLYLSSDQMGAGPDAELGRRLLETFLTKLAASDVRIDAVGCVNAGVFLTTDGSRVLESLRMLLSRGARIASCKTCLDHFGLTDKVRVGAIGTMDQTVAILGQADKIIRP